MRKGEFIVLEGIDGTGKTTQCLKLVEAFAKIGVPHIYAATPRGGDLKGHFTDTVCSMFLGGDRQLISTKTELLLQAACHAEVSGKIKSYLDKGINVVCDRYTMSTIAYQGYGLGNDLEEVMSAVNIASCGLIPSITFILDISPMTAIKRTNMRSEQLHAYDKDVQLLVNARKGYMEASKLKSESLETYILSADKDEEELHLEILSKLFACYPFIFEDCWRELDKIIGGVPLGNKGN